MTQQEERDRMTETDERMRQEMTEAIEAYAGPVTKCPPGRARGKPVKLKPLSPVLPSKAKPKLDIQAERKFLQVDGATRWDQSDSFPSPQHCRARRTKRH
jgi:hypothetical protein